MSILFSFSCNPFVKFHGQKECESQHVCFGQIHVLMLYEGNTLISHEDCMFVYLFDIFSDVPELHSRFIKMPMNVPNAPLVFTLPRTIQDIKQKSLLGKQFAMFLLKLSTVCTLRSSSETWHDIVGTR